ncbi:hypothetical protein A7D35_08480 [Xanthomonas arboricola]|nr:hypothetical protein A7D35_08480 [Xanthomonas arboricola]
MGLYKIAGIGELGLGIGWGRESGMGTGESLERVRVCTFYVRWRFGLVISARCAWWLIAELGATRLGRQV